MTKTLDIKRILKSYCWMYTCCYIVKLYFDESLKFYGTVREISVLMAYAQNLQLSFLYNDISSGLAV